MLLLFFLYLPLLVLILVLSSFIVSQSCFFMSDTVASETAGVQPPISSVFASPWPVLFGLEARDCLLFLPLVMFLVSSRQVGSGVPGTLCIGYNYFEACCLGIAAFPNLLVTTGV